MNEHFRKGFTKQAAAVLDELMLEGVPKALSAIRGIRNKRVLKTAYDKLSPAQKAALLNPASTIRRTAQKAASGQAINSVKRKDDDK